MSAWCYLITFLLVSWRIQKFKNFWNLFFTCKNVRIFLSLLLPKMAPANHVKVARYKTKRSNAILYISICLQCDESYAKYHRNLLHLTTWRLVLTYVFHIQPSWLCFPSVACFAFPTWKIYKFLYVSQLSRTNMIWYKRQKRNGACYFFVALSKYGAFPNWASFVTIIS